MKGFKDSTRTQYSMGGAAYAKGGSAKGAAKVAKVMGEFKKGELHSGSKEGPKVTKPAQAKAIAMSEARKAGMKAPMKKNEGGKIGKMPPLGESVKSGNRMSKMTAAERLAMEARFGEKKRPSPADSAKSANRISAQEAAEARHLGVFKEGGKVRKYAEGGPVEPVRNLRPMPVAMPMPDTALGMFDYSSPASSPDMNDNIRNLLRSYDKYAATGKYDMPDLRNFVNDLNSQFTDNDRIAAKSSLLRDLPLAGTSQVTRRTGGSDYFPGEGRPPPQMPQVMEPPMPPVVSNPFYSELGGGLRLPKQPPVDPGFAIGPRDPNMPSVMPPAMVKQPRAGMVGGLLGALNNPRMQQDLQQAMMQPQAPRRGLRGALNEPLIREDLQRAMMQPPPAGMAPVDPNKAMMMKHGGRAAMSKGKR